MRRLIESSGPVLSVRKKLLGAPIAARSIGRMIGSGSLLVGKRATLFSKTSRGAPPNVMSGRVLRGSSLFNSVRRLSVPRVTLCLPNRSVN